MFLVAYIAVRRHCHVLLPLLLLLLGRDNGQALLCASTSEIAQQIKFQHVESVISELSAGVSLGSESNARRIAAASHVCLLPASA